MCAAREHSRFRAISIRLADLLRVNEDDPAQWMSISVRSGNRCCNGSRITAPGSISLGQLVDDLSGLHEAANSHDAVVRTMHS
jgi:hypothetical protein